MAAAAGRSSRNRTPPMRDAPSSGPEKVSSPPRRAQLFLFPLTLLLLSLAAILSCSLVSPRKKNLLLITIDTLRADYLGCTGNAMVRTPAIDGLSRTGVIFSRAIASVPLTLPSHGSILTGTYPLFHGVRDNAVYRLTDDNLTLAEMLGEKGYRTGAIVASNVLDSGTGFDQGFAFYDDDLRDPMGKGLTIPERRAEEVTGLAERWLEEYGSDPFFLWLHYFDPHAPYLPPPPYDGLFPLSPYAGEVSYVDASIGNLLDYMKNTGLFHNTLIVLCSDHGEGLGDHGESTHGVFLYSSTVRIPIILACPGMIEGGRMIEQQVREIDILPTVLDLLRIEKPAGLDGQSLVPLLEGKTLGPLPCYLESEYPENAFGWSRLTGLRTDRYVYIEAPRPELYDLEADEAELFNILDALPDTAEVLRKELAKAIAEKGHRDFVEAPRYEPDQETLERLRSLGYVSGGPGGSQEKPDPKDMVSVLAGIENTLRLMGVGEPDSALALLDSLGRGRTQGTSVLLASLASDILTRMGRYEEAANTILSMLTTDPSYVEGYENLASLYMRLGRDEKVGEVLAKLLQMRPDGLKGNYLMGSLLLKEGKPEQAILFLEKAKQVNPRSGMVRYLLASAYAGTRELGKAEREARAALETLPGGEEPPWAAALRSLLETLEASGQAPGEADSG